MIGIIDYGMGNLRSVYNAVVFLGVDCRLIGDPKGVEGCSHLILPGVGAYATAMENLRRIGFVPVLKEFAESGSPMLGICLGMQLLSTTGTEPWPCEGLGLIEGEVALMDVGETKTLPHVGWNGFRILKQHPIFDGVPAHNDIYFVHSYRFIPADDRTVVCTTDYGIGFASGIAAGSVVGLQFHPEKSQKTGLAILKNFCGWDGTC